MTTGISTATKADIPALLSLLNKAYRGESAKEGWTHESHLISGEQRTTENTLQELMDKPGSVFLKYMDNNGQLTGCVNLQQDNKGIYLGMLSVMPRQQGGGIGKKLLKAAEDHAREKGCNKIHMTVISIRHNLIDWYKRHGYIDTGEKIAFAELEESGKHLQPLDFMVMEKLV